MQCLNFSLDPKQTFIFFGVLAELQNGLRLQHIEGVHNQ